MNTEEFVSLAQTVVYDLADRLTYLGMHGTERAEYLDIVLSEENLNAYTYILDITSAVSYDRAKHGRDWTGHRLPNPADLPRISDAVGEFTRRGLGFKRSK